MKISSLVFASVFALVSLPSLAAGKLFVQVPAVLDPTAPIISSVKDQCAVEMLTGNYALSALSEAGFAAQPAVSIVDAGQDKFVQLTILNVQGVGGGGWSGSKSMTIRAEVRQGQNVLATVVLSRTSKGGVFGPIKGTCAIFDRVSEVLGKDLAKWLSKKKGELSSAN